MKKVKKISKNIFALLWFYLISRLFFLVSMIESDSKTPMIVFIGFLVTGVLLTILSKFIYRAWIFEIIYVFTLFIPLAVFFYSSTLIILKQILENGSFIILTLNILVVIYSMQAGVHNSMKNLEGAELENIKSGLLNIENGEWDFEKELRWRPEEQQKFLLDKFMKFNYLHYIAPTVGILIARIFSDDIILLVISLIYLIFANVLLHSTSNYIGLIKYTLKLENCKNVEIHYINSN